MAYVLYICLNIIVMKEVWKKIPINNNYEVSNLGNVRSLDYVIVRKNGKKYTNKGRVLKQVVNKAYKTVCLNGCKKYVHQLVAMAFLNHNPNGHKLVVDHIDENKLNNRVDNLQIITNRKNLSKSKKLLNNASKYTGVFYRKNRNKWYSQIVVDKKQIYLGSFNNEYDAHLAYQNKLSTI